MRTFGRCKGGGRRVAGREAVPLIAVLTTVARSHGAILLDLSCSGARLQGHDLPKPGEVLLLAVDGVRSYGTVAWAAEEQCGVAFDEALSPADIMSVVSRAGDRGGAGAAVGQDWSMPAGL